MKKNDEYLCLSISVPRGQEGMDMLKTFMPMLHLPSPIDTPLIMTDGKTKAKAIRWIQLKYSFEEIYVTDQVKDGLTRVIWDGEKVEDKWIDLDAFMMKEDINYECPISLSLLPPRGWQWISVG